MELDFLWTFKAAWKLKLLVVMVMAQMVLTIWLYIKMSKARFAAVKEGAATREDFSVVGSKPEVTGIYTRAVANQFELPVLFYVIILIGLALDISSWITVMLAFLFVVSRIVHAREMIGENRVMKRRGMFINSMRIFILLLLELLISTLFVLKV